MFINIRGAKGSSHFRGLNNKWKNNFERGQEDTFDLKLVELGELKSVSLIKRARLSKKGNDWKVETVTVIDPWLQIHRFAFHQFVKDVPVTVISQLKKLDLNEE